MQMQKKNRSISKGVIEAKDKSDLLRSNQQFSPNVSKRTVGINLNTFLSSKPGNVDPELSDTFKNNHNNTYYNNQSTNLLANNMTTNFQKYTKNFHLNQSKAQLPSNYQAMGNSVSMSANNTNNTFLGNNNNMTNIGNLTNMTNMTNNTNIGNTNSKNLKLESIKNINTVIKKLKNSNVPNKLSSNNKVEIPNTKITNTNLQKKIPNIPPFQSTNLTNLSNLNKGPLINLKTSTCFNQNQNIYSNFSEMSPSTSIANLNINESKFDNTPPKDLFKVHEDVKGSSTNIYLGTKQTDTKKTSTQETNDNSSNNSTIKNYKHSNSSSINGLQLQINKCFKSTNIENPEDLHFFYVKMFQTNKEYVHKFEKEE